MSADGKRIDSNFGCRCSQMWLRDCPLGSFYARAAWTRYAIDHQIYGTNRAWLDHIARRIFDMGIPASSDFVIDRRAGVQGQRVIRGAAARKRSERGANIWLWAISRRSAAVAATGRHQPVVCVWRRTGAVPTPSGLSEISRAKSGESFYGGVSWKVSSAPVRLHRR